MVLSPSASAAVLVGRTRPRLHCRAGTAAPLPWRARCHHCRTDVRERTRAAAVARRTVFSSRALAFCAGSSSCARRARSLNTQLRSATLPATVTVRPPRRQTSSHLPLVFARFRSSYGLQRFTCGLVLAFATSWQHLQFAVRDLREPICNSRSNFRFATPIPELRCARQRNVPVQTFAHVSVVNEHFELVRNEMSSPIAIKARTQLAPNTPGWTQTWEPKAEQPCVCGRAGETRSLQMVS